MFPPLPLPFRYACQPFDFLELRPPLFRVHLQILPRFVVVTLVIFDYIVVLRRYINVYVEMPQGFVVVEVEIRLRTMSMVVVVIVVVVGVMVVLRMLPRSLLLLIVFNQVGFILLASQHCNNKIFDLNSRHLNDTFRIRHQLLNDRKMTF